MTRLEMWLARAVCWLFGHLYVQPEGADYHLCARCTDQWPRA